MLKISVKCTLKHYLKIRERRDSLKSFSLGLLPASHYIHLLILIRPVPISFCSQFIAYFHMGAT